MSFDDGQIKIEKCPVCKKSHEYGLEYIIKAVQAFLTPEKEVDEVITRVDTVFICPKKDKEFEQMVVVLHRIYERVDAVNSKIID